jgi:hypothetical protein
LKTVRASTEVTGLARDLLADEGADFSSLRNVLHALEVVLGRFHGHLRVLIGDGGFRSLIGLAHFRALQEHSCLEEILINPQGKPFLTMTTLASRDESDSRPTDALAALLAETIVLLRTLARDQDWSIAELWPGVRALKEAGLPLRP